MSDNGKTSDKENDSIDKISSDGTAKSAGTDDVSEASIMATEGMSRLNISSDDSAYNTRSGKPTTNERSNGSESGSGSGSGSRGLRPQKTIHGYEAQTFAVRPGLCRAGTDTKVFSNHYSLEMEREEIFFTLYNIEVYSVPDDRRGARGGSRRQITKREDVPAIFWKMVEMYPEVYMTRTVDVTWPDWTRKFPVNFVFNDSNLLYVLGKNGLPQIPSGQRTFDVDCDGRRYTVILKNTGVQSATVRPGAVKEQRDNVVCLFDLILSQRVRSLLHPDCGRFYTHKNNIFLIPRVDWHRDDQPSTDKCVNLWRGFCAWIGLHGAVKINLEHPLLYNVDIMHTVFQKSGTNLLRYVFEVIERTRGMHFDIEKVKNAVMNDRGSFRRRVVQAITGLIVMPNYGPRKRYTVHGLTNNNQTARTSLVPRMGDRREMTVEEYFYDVYNTRLDFPLLPMVVVNKAKRLYIPLECLNLSDLPQKHKGQPAEEQLSYFIRETAIAPLRRKELIEELAGCVDPENPQPGFGGLQAQDALMREWGIQVKQQMQLVDAKFLPRPELEFPLRRHSTEMDKFKAPAEGVWAIADPHTQSIRTALIPPKATAWSLVIVEPDFLKNKILPGPFEFLMNTLHEFGIEVLTGTEPLNVLNWEPNSPNAIPVLEETLEDFKSKCEVEQKTRSEKDPAAGPILPCCLFIFPRKSPEAYRISKYLCEIKHSVYHQGILAGNYEKLHGNILSATTAHNMFFKINAKLGGVHYRIPHDGEHRNWNKAVDRKAPTMFVGVDVTHPGSRDQQKREETRRQVNRPGGGPPSRPAINPYEHSVASIVANIDVDCVQYRMTTRIQSTGEERLVNLTEEITTCIKRFVDHSNVRPAHIVIYRDGVSETEFKRTFYEEKKAFDAALSRIDSSGEYRPTLTYIVVTKRHHTRFFADKRADVFGPALNLRPGLLVEKDIVTNEYFDFYLLSHNGPLGTSRPTHYYVLHDEWQPSSAFWQTITYALCFLYVRTPKSVSLPAPVFYAHLAAKRAADWLKAYEQNYPDELRHRQEYEIMDRKKQATTPSIEGMLFA